jgi:ornithine cyclodeaminase/alanine dehydrogenase-like protein (mu-crystallin family)
MLSTQDGIEKIWVASRSIARAKAVAANDVRAVAAESIEMAVAEADVLCLCTSSPDPVIKWKWLKPGLHITSVGYRPPGGELPRDVVEKSRLFVESRKAFSAPPVGSSELQGLSPEIGTEIGEVLLNIRPGRTANHETTLYKSIGHAMEDLVAANLAYEKAMEQGMGTTVEL